MPSTLPIRRSRGRTVVRTTSTTRLCFSSTTPVSTQVPYVKIPMNIRMIPALAKMTAVVCASVGGSSGSTVGGCSLAASAPARRPMTADDVIAWIRFSASSSTISSPGPERSAGTSSAASIVFARSAALGRRPVRDGADVERDVVLRRPTPSIAAWRPAGGVPTSARFGDSSWPSRNAGRRKPGHQQEHREHERQDVAAAAAALEDLAHRHQPDRAEPPHRAGVLGRRLRRGHGLHEQLRQARGLEREPSHLAGAAGRRQQRREVRVLVDEQLHPVAVALDDRRAVEALEPRAAVARDLDLEVAPAGGGLQRVDLAVGDDAPAADDHDVLADLLDEVELVRAEHDADARPRRARAGPRSSSGRRAGRGPRTARRGRAAPGRGRAPSRAGSAAGCRATGLRASTSRGRRARTARARRAVRVRASRPDSPWCWAKYASCSPTRIRG